MNKEQGVRWLVSLVCTWRGAASVGLDTSSLLMAAWLVGSRGDAHATPQAGAQSGRPTRGLGASPPAFTLIELIVVIAIVAVLIAIVLPALGHAKRSGKSAERLSAVRQCLSATTQYADSAAGYLPFLATPGAPELGVFPDGDWGDSLPPSYFRGQSQLWPTALLGQGMDLSHLPESSRPDSGPERVHTYFWMTHAAVAQPEYWLHGDPPNNPSLFSGVRLSGATFPSAKGLIGFVGWTAQEAESLSAWEVGMADGSAALRSVHDPPLQVDGPYRPFGAVDWRVLTTLEGIRGRDY
jgi:prepilin-type N-terminal cleavage/methylation domain-containing protein